VLEEASVARTGRRPGDSATREAILAAARDAFAARGYAGATIRQIASAAAVDPALVHHYFVTKERLFLTVLHTAVDPDRLLSHLLSGDVQMLGERIVERFLVVWDGGAGATASGLLRTGVTGERLALRVLDVVLPAVVNEMVTTVGVDPADASSRTTLIASQLSGLVLTRYVLKLPPMASAPIRWVVAAVGPTIQRYLTGDLPELPGVSPT
jgi:AcrR family transcriptional regulator